jgi:folate-binding protein YgfZ
MGSNLARLYEDALQGLAKLPLSQFAVLKIEGPDSRAWLQGQLTQDVRALHPGTFARACILTPTGQVTADVGVAADSERFFILMESTLKERVRERLYEFLIIEDVAISDCDHMFEWSPFSQDGDFKGDSEAVSFCAEPRTEHLAELFEILRIEKGLPMFSKDYDAKTLPLELGGRFVQSRISFQKGCYVGQEVVHRIYARGHTNRKWIGLRSDKPMQPGDEVLAGSGEPAGRVTSAAVSPRLGPIARAMIKNQRLGQSLLIRGEPVVEFQ